jgi:uncharacterized protein (DUF736 family)
MATIGTFTKHEDGFTGSLKTLALNVKLKIVPIAKDNGNGPDYRVLAGATEIGAAWKRQSKANNADKYAFGDSAPIFFEFIFESLDLIPEDKIAHQLISALHDPPLSLSAVRRGAMIYATGVKGRDSPILRGVYEDTNVLVPYEYGDAGETCSAHRRLRSGKTCVNLSVILTLAVSNINSGQNRHFRLAEDAQYEQYRDRVLEKIRDALAFLCGTRLIVTPCWVSRSMRIASWCGWPKL